MTTIDPMFAVFDHDGTLSDADGRQELLERDPPDWEAFHAAGQHDPPVEHICALARMMFRDGHRVEIWTGRTERYRQQTVDWLARHDIKYHALRMRADGDFRSGHTIKMEWMEEAGLPDIMFEDSTRAAEQFRASGLAVVQVASHDY